MKPRPDSVIRYAVSCVIAKYPDRPTTTQRDAVVDFMALPSKLFGLARSRPDTQSRTALTAWAQENFSVWAQADYAAASPARWGPYMWRLMFRCAAKYTHKRRGLYWAWLKSLQYMLPCSKCAWHFRRMLLNSYRKWRHVKSRKHMTRYVKWMHSKVRRRVHRERKKKYFGSKDKTEWPGTQKRRNTNRTKRTDINMARSILSGVRDLSRHRP
jgi:hypothetical protein